MATGICGTSPHISATQNWLETIKSATLTALKVGTLALEIIGFLAICIFFSIEGVLIAGSSILIFLLIYYSLPHVNGWHDSLPFCRPATSFPVTMLYRHPVAQPGLRAKVGSGHTRHPAYFDVEVSTRIPPNHVPIGHGHMPVSLAGRAEPQYPQLQPPQNRVPVGRRT